MHKIKTFNTFLTYQMLVKPLQNHIIFNDIKEYSSKKEFSTLFFNNDSKGTKDD